VREGGVERSAAAAALVQDYRSSGARGRLSFADPAAIGRTHRRGAARGAAATPARQARHLLS
jgi:hypothetical protein